MRQAHQGWLTREGRHEALAASLEAEAAASTGTAAAWPLYRLAQVRELHLGDAEGALAGLLLASLALSGLLIFSALRTSKDALSLASFARSMATEGDLHGFGSHLDLWPRVTSPRACTCMQAQAGSLS